MFLINLMIAPIPAKLSPTAAIIANMFQYKVKSFILYDVNKSVIVKGGVMEFCILHCQG